MTENKKPTNQMTKDKRWAIFLACLLFLAAIGCGIVLSLRFISINEILSLNDARCGTSFPRDDSIIISSFLLQAYLGWPALVCILICIFATRIKVVSYARRIFIIGAIALIIISYATVNISSMSAIKYYRENEILFPRCQF